MNRRKLLTILGGAATASALTIAAHAQQIGAARIGVLMPYNADDVQGREFVEALRQGLQDRGWNEGRNVEVDYRWIGENVSRRSLYAAELIAAGPNVLFACYLAQLAPLARETRDIPIVFIGVSDPIASGYVTSFARPGGNITGFTLYEASMAGKWLEMLRVVAPSLKRVAIMINPDTAVLRGTFYLRAFENAASTMAIQPLVSNVYNTADVEAAISGLAHRPDSGLIVAPETFTEVHREWIVQLASRYRIPTIYGTPEFTRNGGLISYGPNRTDTVRRAASYLDRILRGEKAAELPVQAPTQYELIINLATARTLGLDIPPTLLARADEVIE
jgi:putative ABC transport system substrate-binding protein